MSKTELTRKEKQIAKLEEQILNPETLEALESFKKNLQVIARTAGRITRHKNRNESYTRAEIAAFLGIKTKDLFEVDAGVPIENASYAMTLLIEKKEASNPFKNPVELFDTGARRMWSSAKEISIEGEVIICESIPALFEKENYLAIPKRSQIGFNYSYTIVTTRENMPKAIQHFRDTCVEYAPFKNSFISVGDRTFEIRKLTPKFNMSKIVVNENIRTECELISKMFKQYSPKDSFSNTICFHGEPGTGKTTSVQAIAQSAMENGGTVFSITVDNTHTAISVLSAVLKLASEYAPALVIFEDIDLISTDRSYGGGVTSQLLQLFSGTEESKGVMCVLTTNDFESIDKAMKRRGRIDRLYYFDAPNREEKIELIDNHFEYYKVKLSKKEGLKALQPLLSSDKATGADISSAIESAMQRAKAEQTEINTEILTWACNSYQLIQKHRVGFQKKA